MCGIHVVVSKTPRPLSSDLASRLRNRGPDHLGSVEVAIGSRVLSFTSTVLALRGGRVTKQPFFEPDSGSVLCWNGEAWKLAGQLIVENDGEAIFAMLKKASASRRPDTVLDVLRSIEGPFAFVYLDAPSQTLYYGRDRIGRRSLEICYEEDAGLLVLSSVPEACVPSWCEVEADGIYSLSLGTQITQPATRHAWQTGGQDDVISGIGVFNESLHSASSVLTVDGEAVQSLGKHLLTSLVLRVLNIPQPPSSHDATVDTRVAVLFSGGLDCTVLARLTHDLLPAEQGIDLLNVAFENPRVVAQLQKEAKGQPINPYEACPDRLTGRQAFAELQKACPGRTFRFVAVNVPYSETLAHRSEVVSLIYPHDTEMDLSIAYALYFAARGHGLCSQADAAELYTTPARVLLSGLGADELFGGYIRHATAFSRQGYTGLVDELKLDVRRLGARNLGRDDRAMAHWSKEVRFPFLDEGLVRWAMETPVWDKCDFANGEELSGVEAGKRVLRLLALQLGLEQTAREKKRAIQFGSRTAKMESGRSKGTTRIA